MLADIQRTTADTPTPVATSRPDDERIVRAALRALEREHIVPAGRFVVNVDRGWLTLDGRAEHFAERSAAECIVRYVQGVAGVTNRLVIAHADR